MRSASWLTWLQKALAYSELAARRAMNVYAYSEAVRHLEQALKVQEVLEPDNRTKRCDVLLALGEALVSAGEPLRAYQEVAEEAFILAEGLDDEERAARACRVARTAIRGYGGVVTNRSSVGALWREREGRVAQPGTADRVRVDLNLARQLHLGGQASRARDLGLQAMGLARELANPEALFAAAFHFLQQVAPQDWGLAASLLEELPSWTREKVRVRDIGWTLLYAGNISLAQGHRSEAEHFWRHWPTS